jgi:tRNA pseudouridine38-40 synthase
MNVKITVEYDGTAFHGWQVQPNGKTVQQALEQALERILGVKTRVNGSGRTDAGVHALGQVANFFCGDAVDLRRLTHGLNALVRPDIVISRAEVVPDSFDSRRDARSRVYQYRIWNQRRPSVFHHRYAWHVPDSLDLDLMRQAIEALEGEHDFTSFQAAGCDAAHPVRRVYRNSIDASGDLLLYTIEATAFLRHMVRNIVGTLAQVGRGDLDAGGFAELLRLRDRKLAGPTAPPQGLFLMEVKY